MHDRPVRVNYGVVRDLVPTLWDDPGQKADVVLHIGMAGPERVYQIERRGHRDGYRIKDVDGLFLNDEQRHADEGAAWIWHGLPHELLTDLDVDDVHRRWVARSPVRVCGSLFPRPSLRPVWGEALSLWLTRCHFPPLTEGRRPPGI